MPCTVHDLQRGTCYDAIIIIQISFGHKAQVRGCRLANCHSSTVRLTVSDIISWSNAKYHSESHFNAKRDVSLLRPPSTLSIGSSSYH